MMTPRRVAVLLACASVVCLAVSVLLSPPRRPADSVVVSWVATTNGASGTAFYIFSITNRLAENLNITRCAEVLHQGFWFNALPQPFPSGDFLHLPSAGSVVFAVPAPAGRAESGLTVQPRPPGTKWRVVVAYGRGERPLEYQVRELLGLKHHGRVVGPEMSFAPPTSGSR